MFLKIIFFVVIFYFFLETQLGIVCVKINYKPYFSLITSRLFIIAQI
jgi:hypothetical protein